MSREKLFTIVLNWVQLQFWQYSHYDHRELKDS